MTKLALAFAVLAACSPPPKPLTAADPNPAGAPTCEVVRDHVISVMGAPDLGGIIQARCADDHWSAEARACLVESTIDTVGRCEDLLTPAQKTSLESSFPPPKPAATRSYKSSPNQPRRTNSGDPCEGGQ
jgi:hypothetical protein